MSLDCVMWSIVREAAEKDLLCDLPNSELTRLADNTKGNDTTFILLQYLHKMWRSNTNTCV